MKCTITIEDNDENEGQIKVNIDFFPPVDDKSECTSASTAAIHVFKTLCKMGRTFDCETTE